jgi:hypothetical protein
MSGLCRLSMFAGNEANPLHVIRYGPRDRWKFDALDDLLDWTSSVGAFLFVAAELLIDGSGTKVDTVQSTSISSISPSFEKNDLLKINS